MKRFILYSTAGLILICMITAGALAVWVQTDSFRAWVKQTAVEQAQPFLNGDLSVERLEGDLLSEIILRNVRIETGDETPVSLARLSVSYDLWALWENQIVVNEIHIEQLDLALRAEEDGTWNMARLIAETEATPENADTTGFAWPVQVERFRLTGGVLRFSGLDSTSGNLPDRIEDISFAGRFALEGERMNIGLDSLRFETMSPDLAVSIDETQITVTDDSLGTTAPVQMDAEQSALTTDIAVEMNEASSPAFDISVEAQPLDLQDVRRLVNDLNVYGRPELRLQAEGSPDDMRLTADISFSAGRIALQLRLIADDEDYAYEGSVDIDRLNPGRILNRAELNGLINMRVDVDGRSFDPEQLAGRFDLQVDRSRMMGYQVENFTSTARIGAQEIALTGRLDAYGASTTFDASLDLSDTRPSYRMSGDFRRLDLQPVIQDTSLSTEMNGRFTVQGAGETPENLRASIALHLSPSRFQKINIDTTIFIADIAEGTINIHDLRLQSPLGRVALDGVWSAAQAGSLAYIVEATDLAPMAALAGQDSLSGSVRITGSVSGSLDDLITRTTLTAQAALPGVRVDSIYTDIEGRLLPSPALTTRGHMTDVIVGELAPVEAEWVVGYADSIADFNIAIWEAEDLSIRIAGDLTPETATAFVVRLDSLVLQKSGQQWRTSGDRPVIRYQPERVAMADLRLSYLDQHVTVNGEIDTTGDVRMRLKAETLQLPEIMELADMPDTTYKAVISADIELTGRPETPEINGHIQLSDLAYADYRAAWTDATFRFAGQTLQTHVVLSQTGTDSLLAIQGETPLMLSLSPFESRMPEDQPLNMAVTLQPLDLTIIEDLLPDITDLQGRLSADILLYNSLEDLSGEGKILLSDAAFRLPELGTAYRDGLLEVNLRERRLHIDNFRLRSGDGKITINESSLGLSQRQVEDFSVRMQVDDFPVMDNNRMKAKLNGDLILSGSVQAIEMDGRLTAQGADIYYTNWIEEEESVVLYEQPFFVIKDDSLTLPLRGKRDSRPALGGEPLFTETDVYKGLHGRITVALPRNVWLRSEEARIEVEGEVQLEKQVNQDFVLFGEINTVRGYYEVQGNRFDIVEGSIRFKGEPVVNPDLRIIADHQFIDRSADDRTERVIRIVIGGTVEVPAFSFLLDGEQAEQKDIFSILLFGRPFDQLSIGQRNSVSEEAGMQGQGLKFLAGAVLKRLSSELERELNLDVLEIESGESITDARIRVGKYVTPDVFVSVSQDLDAEGDQEVALEYRLPRELVYLNLFLRAIKDDTGQSAVDLIWKLDW